MIRPCHWVPFGTLVFLLAACSSRGGESLFEGEAPPQDVDVDVDAGADGDAPSGDVPDASGEADAEPDEDAAIETDAGDDATDAPDAPGELPPATIECGNEVCTSPQYCCRPPSNVNIPGVSASCKDQGTECRFGVGPIATDGIPQHCAAHADCAGGQCCAIRVMGGPPNQPQPQNRYERVECVLKCETPDVEVCDPDNPQCTSGTCRESTILRGVYVCGT